LSRHPCTVLAAMTHLFLVLAFVLVLLLQDLDPGLRVSAFRSRSRARPTDFDPDYCLFLNQLAQTPNYVAAATPATSLAAASDFLLSALRSIPAADISSWNVSRESYKYVLQQIHLQTASCTSNSSIGGFEYHPYTAQQEGAISAPVSHAIVYENKAVRVIHWQLTAQYREPYHTHGLASIMWLLLRAGRKYYFGDVPTPASVSPVVDPGNPGPVEVSFMGPEWLHSIENVDMHTYEVIRIEFLPADNTQYHWPQNEILG